MSPEEVVRRRVGAISNVRSARKSIERAQAELDDALQILAQVQGAVAVYYDIKLEIERIRRLWVSTRDLLGAPDILLDRDPAEELR